MAEPVEGVFKVSQPDDLYEYPTDHVGKKTYVTVQGHSRSVPKFKTYMGSDRKNHLRPEYGGNYDHLGQTSAFFMPDKAGYVSPMSGELVEGRSAHREHMRVHNVIEAGDVRMGHMSGIERAPMPSVGADVMRAIAELSSR